MLAIGNAFVLVLVSTGFGAAAGAFVESELRFVLEEDGLILFEVVVAHGAQLYFIMDAIWMLIKGMNAAYYRCHMNAIWQHCSILF